MTDEQKEMLADITKKYRLLSGMTLEAFGEYLCGELLGARQQRQNIFNWEKGVQPVPRYFAMMVWLAYNKKVDLRASWALECLKVIDAQAWEGVSEVSE